jgi:hypothetical protein
MTAVRFYAKMFANVDLQSRLLGVAHAADIAFEGFHFLVVQQVGL